MPKSPQIPPTESHVEGFHMAKPFGTAVSSGFFCTMKGIFDYTKVEPQTSNTQEKNSKNIM